MSLVRLCVIALLAWAPMGAGAETYLLMAEERGCLWCARWNDDIAPIYPKTPEGQAAPLRRYDIADGTPDDVTVLRRVHYTPTFLLIRDGKEVARIEGYPGEDFFWGLLGRMLQDAQIDPAQAG